MVGGNIDWGIFGSILSWACLEGRSDTHLAVKSKVCLPTSQPCRVNALGNFLTVADFVVGSSSYFFLFTHSRSLSSIELLNLFFSTLISDSFSFMYSNNDEWSILSVSTCPCPAISLSSVSKVRFWFWSRSTCSSYDSSMIVNCRLQVSPRMPSTLRRYRGSLIFEFMKSS